jgi:hypothetical protein
MLVKRKLVCILEKYLYGVANNGFAEVRRYGVKKETPWTYVLDTKPPAKISKSSMCTEFEFFYLNEERAKDVLKNIRLSRGLPTLENTTIIPGKKVEY